MGSKQQIITKARLPPNNTTTNQPETQSSPKFQEQDTTIKALLLLLARKTLIKFSEMSSNLVFIPKYVTNSLYSLIRSSTISPPSK